MQSTTSPRPWRRLRRVLASSSAAGMVVVAGGVHISPAIGEPLPVTSAQDVTPPQISNLVIDPLEVDVSDGVTKSFTATVTATDDLAGVNFSFTGFYRLPGQLLEERSVQFNFARVSGDSKNGTYKATAPVRALQPSGVYQFSSLLVPDAVGNVGLYSPSGTSGPASLTVRSHADSTPPSVTAMRILPNPLDVSERIGSATIEFDATDEGSGLAQVSGQFISPSGRQSMSFYAGPVAGLPGTARAILGTAQYSEPGDWRMNELCAHDKAGNQQCLNPYTTPPIPQAFLAPLTVVSNPADRQRPQVTAVRMSPGALDVTGSDQTVSVQFDVKDELSGIDYVSALFRSPPTAGASPEIMVRGASAHAPYLYHLVQNAQGETVQDEDESQRVLSGTLTGTVTFPQYDRNGDWTLSEVCITDRVRWKTCYDASSDPPISTLGPTKLPVVWNRPPVVTVTGVTQTSYEAGAEPTPVCEISDPEDGVMTGVRPAVTISGATVTATCTYTDGGVSGGLSKRTGTASVSYFVTRPANTAPTVHVSGIVQASYEIGNEPAAACKVDDTEDANEAATPQVSALSGPQAQYGAGSRSVTCSYTDAGGLTGSHSVTYTLTDTGKPTLSGEPATQPNSAGWYNSDVTIRWTATDSGVGVDPATVPAAGLVSANGTGQTETASVTDRAGNAVTATSSPAVNLDKTAPTMDSLTLGANPRAVSQATSVSASASDSLAGVVRGEYFLDVDPGRGKGIALTSTGAKLSGSIGTDLTPGVYTVGVRAVDAAGNWSAVTSEYLVVYDPTGGYVTGGGRLDSPAGAYRADATRTGRAAFGFVSKYQQGATVPTGNTEFHFQAGDLTFSSSSYEWLVVSGPKAQYKGEGTVNGQAGYNFLLTATDGEIAGGGGVDKFRIKIWNAGGTVYDNGGGVPDDLTGGQAIASGSIVIHK